MRLLIVGGGSSGWITAAWLASALNRDGRRAVDIALVESPDVGRIGVGEATIPSIRRFLTGVGLGEHDFVRSCNATFKQGIVFENWLGGGDGYMHPFHRYQGVGADAAFGAWLRSDGRTPFADLVTPQRRVAQACLAPKMRGAPDYDGDLGYAYHLDAELFAERLAALAMARGVRRISAHVAEVERAASGDIAAVRAADGRRFEADLFVDCTGFRRLLIGALGARRLDASQWLLCDSAVTMRVPYDVHRPERLRPYTRATALGAGWAWDIGLKDRRGRGYVYASAFIEPEAAEADLRALEGPHAAALPARHLRFEVGRVETPWLRNCVAIGLSAGFVEPLESTGLYFSELGAQLLGEYFPLVQSCDGLARRYNALMNQNFDAVVDFINLHYVLSDRRDTAFWREATQPQRTSPGNREFLEMWNVKPPSRSDFCSNLQLFSSQNYEYIMCGMGWRPDALAGEPPQIKVTPAGSVEQKTEALLQALPTHEDLIADYHQH